MTEMIKSEAISRRSLFTLFGLAIATTVAVPATLMSATEAEARVGQPLSPVSVAGAARRADRRGYKKKKMKPTPDAAK
jgi:secreted PhoX family phosphatase